MENESDRTQVKKISDLMAEARAESKQQAYLIVLAGSQIGKMYRVGGSDSTIGRGRSADLVLDDDGISREHVQVVSLPDGGVGIRDLGSTNGTLVNGEQLGERPVKLLDGDRIQIGGAVMLKFSYQDQLEEAFQQKLYTSAVRDPLTGAFNKGYLSERLDQEFSYSRRHQMPLSLLVLDLDHFKRVNDTHGHAAGDVVLKTVVQRLRGQLRLEEVLARFGGEEFVVVLRETDLGAAERCAERLRKAVGTEPIPWAKGVIPVTVSIGVASTAVTEFGSAQQLFDRADAMLYEAKHGGRNRVVCDRPGF